MRNRPPARRFGRDDIRRAGEYENLIVRLEKLLLPETFWRKKMGMTISKFPLFLCAFAVGSACLSAGAQDNPAQAAAREALAKQLSLVQATNEPSVNSTPAPQPAAPPAAQPTPPPVVPPPTPAATNAPAPVTGNQKTEAEMAALAAALATHTNDVATNAPLKKARKKAKPAPIAVVTNQVAPPVVSISDTNYIGSETGMKPVAAPPLPIAPNKIAQLDALLQKYQADQITPDEYHKQRAAILAQP